MIKLLEGFISKIKKEKYVFEDNIRMFDIVSIVVCKLTQIIRGEICGVFIKKKGLFFKGKRVRIKHPWNVSCGRNLILDDNVYINGLIRQNIMFGNNVSIGRNTIIDCTGVLRELGESLSIGDNVGISPYCFFGVRGAVKIGNNTILGPYVSLHAENHIFEDIDTAIRLQGTTRKGINIGSNCWIGAKATILDGVTIGNGVIVAAGSVVNTNFPDNVVIGGVPARILKTRNKFN